MKTMIRIGKTSFGILLLMVVVVVLVHQVSGLPAYFSELQNIYGNGSCITCHVNSSGAGILTEYGDNFANQSDHTKDPAIALRSIGAPHAKAPIKMSMFVLALQGVYGNGSCTTCHIEPNGGDELTAYGKKFAVQSNYSDDPIAALRSIGAPDAIMTSPDKTEHKSPGFGIVAVIIMMSTIYMLRRNKIKTR